MKVSGFSINDRLWQGLRICQQKSITTGLRYLKKPLTKNVKSCLISLPTGAGKSGVISVISHKATHKKILVICHRRAVCDQLFKDINGKFFSERAENEVIKLKPVFNKIDDTTQNGVYVSTFQKLASFNAKKLNEVKHNIDLIIIDEGHAEPSSVWRTLVRGLKAHKIIITATPYRNDLFQFDISDENSFIYTFEKALEDRILRQPIFERIKQDKLIETIKAFLKDNAGTKCIIKCNKYSDVETYYDLLNEQFKVLAIHDRYSKEARINTKSSVPANLENSDYEVIIHQRKLDEGVDIPQAKLLILTYSVKSGRELVQTVGRVVRLFDDIEPKVLEFESDSNSIMWSNYRKFDASLNDTDAVKKFIASLDVNRLIELYLEAFPDASYYGNKFLSKFDLNAFEPERSLNIPTASICFLTKGEGFNLQLLSDALYWRCNNDGELAKQFDSRFGIQIIVSIAFNKSKFLSDQFFFEPSFEVTLFKELANGVIAIYDSRGRRFANDTSLKLGSALPLDSLLKVTSLGQSASTKEASSKSISSVYKRPESIAIKGKNLDEIASQQGNASYRLATARFDTFDQFKAKSGSYYVGADSGRISDQKESSFSLNDLNGWLQQMDGVISSAVQNKISLVESFAKPVKVELNQKIESIIFDFSEYEHPLNIMIGDESFELDNSFVYLTYDEGVQLIDGVESSQIIVTFQNEEPYLCLSTVHQILYSIEEGVEPCETISDFLYKHLHKILLNEGVSFSEGKFYQVALPLENSFDLANSNLANVVIGLEKLTGPNLDEKGYVNNAYQVNNQEFSPDSVFYQLDKLKSNGLQNPTKSDLGVFSSYIPDCDIVLNTDMGTEPADFIISSKNKLAYVHVKCGNTINPRSAAGALAEVGSQAIKNIEMLISGNELLKPGNWERLKTSWPTREANPSIIERIRLFKGQHFNAVNVDYREEKLQELWELISKRRRSTAVRKEIWIVAANSFSATHFQSQLLLGHDAHNESLQAFQLINSWVSSSHGNDVDLKIFVSV